VTNAPIDVKFTEAHFDKVQEGFGLFKIAARDKLSKLAGSQKVQYSKKYQVLCDETAFVGVVKQKNKASGKMMEFAVEFGKSVKSQIDEEKKS
jgi:hypothetical protein